MIELGILLLGYIVCYLFTTSFIPVAWHWVAGVISASVIEMICIAISAEEEN